MARQLGLLPDVLWCRLFLWRQDEYGIRSSAHGLDGTLQHYHSCVKRVQRQIIAVVTFEYTIELEALLHPHPRSHRTGQREIRDSLRTVLVLIAVIGYTKSPLLLTFTFKEE